MSNFPPSDPPAQSNTAFAAAVERAQQVASKLKTSDSAGGSIGVKRPLGEPGGGPDNKRPSIPGAPAMEGVASEEITVPDRMVGMIIGRGGEQISKLQAESGCKIQMAPDSGGMPDRKCTLSGSSQSIAKAKTLINMIVAGGDMKGGNMGGGGGGGGGGFYEAMIPGHKVGLIIGKGGETIKMLQEQTGAKIAIIQDSAEQADQKPLRISGQPAAVEMAKARVNELLNQGDGQNGFGGRGGMRGGRGGPMRGGPPGRGGPMMGRGRGRGGGSGWPSSYDNGGEKLEYVPVPANKVGLVIGKGGETIKSINQSSGAHCEIDKKAPPDATEKNFMIRGTPEAVEKAKQMVLEKIGASPGSGYGSFPGQSFGAGANNYNGQQQGYQPQQNPYQPAPAPGGAINPTTGQPDYSAQWVEYYRSLGMMREAEMIEQQAAAQSAAPAAAPHPQAAAAPAAAAGGGAADYSAQWVEYYRSVGKIKEAEAIEAQMRAKAAGGQPAYPAQFPGQQPGYPVQGYYPTQPQQGSYP